MGVVNELASKVADAHQEFILKSKHCLGADIKINTFQKNGI
jgi:hypothetical protein